jgi:uncharacterized protein (UPF0548 family)
MFRLTEPSRDDVRRFLQLAADSPLSYADVGVASMADPAGYQVDEAETLLGTGTAVFERGVEALQTWKMFDLGWMRATPSAQPIAPSVNVAVAARHLGFWSMNGCRVVYMVEPEDEVRRFGFAYGTLADHAEQGEERFEVSLEPDTGKVFYRLRAVSRPRAVLAKLGYPYTRLLQARFRRDSCRRMRQAVG